MPTPTTIEPQGTINTLPLEIYGSGPRILRIGNGGAGHTGLLRALSESYLSTHGPGSISWTYNLSRNTHLALLHKHIDISLTYDRALEATAASEGWSTTVACAFHDHFVLAGPIHDPLKLHDAPTIDAALELIAAAGRSGKAAWHARADRSATMVTERSLWTGIGLRPWGEEWYRTNLESPADALIAADGAGAYHLTDRSTLLRQTARGTVSATTVFFEPREKGDVLLNSCCAGRAVHADKGSEGEVMRFLEWLVGEDGQKVVGDFGIEEAGLPLFARVEDGYCRSLLKGGQPRDGRWAGGNGT